jgi:sulfotransferase family protein
MKLEMANQPSTYCDDPILIGSCGSSGGTLLSVMLDAHSEVLSGPELALFAHPFFWNKAGTDWRDPLMRYLDEGYRAVFRPEWTLVNGFCPYAGLVYDNTLPWYGLTRERLKEVIGSCDNGRELARAIYEPLLAKCGKRRWAERSPQNIYAFSAFLDAYPRGRVVYLVRDVRDTVCSLMRKQWGGFKRSLAFWLLDTTISETFRDHPRAHRIRYEDLVANPRETIGNLLEFLGVAPDVERVINFHTTSTRASNPDASSVGQPTWHRRPTEALGSEAVGAWKQTLTAEQLACLAAATVVTPVADHPQVTGWSVEAMVEQLGYEPIDATGADVESVLRLIQAERLFMSGSDYARPDLSRENTGAVHETHVECDPARLPEAAFSWADKRVLAKFDDVRCELNAAHHELQAVSFEQRAAKQKPRTVRDEPRTVKREPHWPVALVGKVRKSLRSRMRHRRLGRP